MYSKVASLFFFIYQPSQFMLRKLINSSSTFGTFMFTLQISFCNITIFLIQDIQSETNSLPFWRYSPLRGSIDTLKLTIVGLHNHLTWSTSISYVRSILLGRWCWNWKYKLYINRNINVNQSSTLWNKIHSCQNEIYSKLTCTPMHKLSKYDDVHFGHRIPAIAVYYTVSTVM